MAKASRGWSMTASWNGDKWRCVPSLALLRRLRNLGETSCFNGRSCLIQVLNAGLWNADTLQRRRERGSLRRPDAVRARVVTSTLPRMNSGHGVPRAC